ncbi:MAG: hypothetical protein WCT99_03490 [Bacteroidota bacterium]|jgi:hypothetical protein
MKIPIFAHVAAISYIVPAYFSVRMWKHLDRSLKGFAVFSIISVGQTIAEFVLGRLGIHNQFLLNYYQLIEFVFVMYLFFYWAESGFFKEGIQYITMIYVLTWMIYKFYFEDPDKFSEVIAPLSSFFFIIVSGYSLIQLFQSATTIISKTPMFWFSTGVFLYSAGTIIIFLFSNAILAMGIEYFNALWHVNWAFTLIANFCFSKGFWCTKL